MTSEQPRGMADLVREGVLTEAMSEVLMACVEGRVNIFIYGDHDSPTDILQNALLERVGADDKVLIVEEPNSSKIHLRHAGWKRITSEPTTEQVSPGPLEEAIFKVNPDRLIIRGLNDDAIY